MGIIETDYESVVRKLKPTARLSFTLHVHDSLSGHHEEEEEEARASLQEHFSLR